MEEIIVVEKTEIAVSDNPNPPHKSQSFPLTFFDALWYLSLPAHYILTYKCLHADHTVIPGLKQSLSAALGYYYPLAGKLLLNPSTSSDFEIRIDDGDSISFVVAECNSDFDYFVGKNNTRSVKRIVCLLPHLPPPTKISDSILAPVFALQVTIFPKKGICIGFTWRHPVGDASTIVAFSKAWASIYKNGSDLTLLASGELPSYDRSLVSQTHKIQNQIFVHTKNFETPMVDFSNTPNDMVRSSFFLSRSDLQNLKARLLAKYPTMVHVSSFVVMTGYFWSCLAKVLANSGEKTSDYLVFTAECGPPLPKTYFGNCVAFCVAQIKSSDLQSEEGFINAAKTIGEAITKFRNSESELVKKAENWISDILNNFFHLSEENL